MMSSTLARFSQHPSWSQALAVIQTLTKAGHETVLAGGAVRDALMGRAIHDLDIATSATPDEVEKVFPKTIAVGKAFGVMVVLFDGASFEVATFRQDGEYRDGRRPETIRFANLSQDAWRRDFTVNALYFSPTLDRIIDVVDGIRDIRHRILRAVGRPEERFREDHLRILRVIRFAAQLGFQIDAPTWMSACRLSAAVRDVSVERQAEELRKMALSARPELGWQLLRDSGVLAAIMPEMMSSLHQHAHQWQEFIKIYSVTKGAPIEIQLATWAALIDLPTSSLEAWLRHFHMSQSEVQAAEQFLRAWEILKDPKTAKLQRWRALDLDESPWVINALVLSAGSGLSLEQSLNADLRGYLERMNEAGRLPRPILTGQDLKLLGFVAGKEMGQSLQDLYELQIVDGLSKDELMAKAKQLKAKS